MTICQTDSTLTLICLVISKWVLSLIWQAFYKLYKICFLYTFFRKNEKAAKIWCFAPTSPFYILHFTDGLSIWTYPFIMTCLDILKASHLINSKKILGKFYATTAPCFWTMHLLVLLNAVFGFSSKKCVGLWVPFLLHQILFLRGLLFKKLLFLQLHSQIWDNFWQLEAL